MVSLIKTFDANNIAAPARRLGRKMLDLLLPPRCLTCTTLLDRAGSLCGSCWAGLDFITAPVCQVCGWPFEYHRGEGAWCGACVARQPRFDRARSVFRYQGQSRKLILAFKHGDRLETAPAFGRWMLGAGGDLFEGCDLIVPVPLHRTRLFARRYNQAALLAHALSRETGITAGADIMARVRRTPSQAGLSRNQRIKNVRGAFSLTGAAKARVKGRNILLVDDVMTTGATVEACAKVLRRAGAGRVDVLTLARVVHQSQVHI